MSTFDTVPMTFRQSFERTAALLLSLAIAITVAGGAIAMCVTG